jgi:uncharacterized membrane protein
MSTDAPPAVPSTREFTLLGISYGLYALGLVMFWPAFIGLVIAYVRRGDTSGTFIASHYTWLIRTFWAWLIGFAAGMTTLAAYVLPAAVEVGKTAKQTHQVRLPWEMLGGAVVGGMIMTVVWCWVVYRLVRGTLRLADARDVP